MVNFRINQKKLKKKQKQTKQNFEKMCFSMVLD